MERKDSNKRKKKPTPTVTVSKSKGPGMARRNSTTVASQKKKKPPPSPAKDLKSSSFDVPSNESTPMGSTDLEASTADPNRLQNIEEGTKGAPKPDSDGSSSKVETTNVDVDDKPTAAASANNEDDLMAVLNANLANMIEKDKMKKNSKKWKAKIKGADKEVIQQDNLLKPTDIPKEPDPDSNQKSSTEIVSTRQKTDDQDDDQTCDLDNLVATDEQRSDAESKFGILMPKKVSETMSPEDRERMLKEIIVFTFQSAAERNERARSNKWLRWKYADELTKDMKWMDGGVEDLGWAVGRRIYEKDEIEKVDEKYKLREKSALFESRKITLKEAPGIFGLWDNVYHTSVVKSMDGAARWDPTKIAKMEKRTNNQKDSSSEEESGEEEADGSGGEPDDENPEAEDDGEIKYDDEGNKIEKKSKKKKKKKKTKDEKSKKTSNKNNVYKKENENDGLAPEDLKILMDKTTYTESEIKKWYSNFCEECPSGKLSKAHMQRLFKRIFPIGDSAHFCDYIFRLFDADQNNVLEFKEFLQAIEVVTRKSEDERLQWAFKLFDQDKSGKINVKEMAAVLETLEGLEGKQVNPGDPKEPKIDPKKKSPAYMFAEKVFKLMDDDNDGELNMEEFVKGYQKLRARQNSSAVTVTAYVHERISKPSKKHNKEEEPPMEIPKPGGRRKSLRDGALVKSMF